MTAFTSSTAVSLTLDEWDILTLTGQSRLVIAVSGQPTFETTTFGQGMVIGPFGKVTTIQLSGIGSGSYAQSPSNTPVPMAMVDISAAQQISPTAAQLAATSTLYQLNAPPYTIYQSNGSALTQMGLSGTQSVIQVTPTTYVIPLDTIGAGKQFTDLKIVDTNATLTVGPNPQPYGCLAATYVGDGSHTLSYGTIKNTNGYTFDNSQGQQNCYFFVYDGFGNALLSGYAGSKVVGITPPTLVSATVSDTDATKIQLVWSTAMNSSISAAAAFTVSSGHTLTAHPYTDSTHSYLTTSTAFLGTESAKTLAYTQPGSNPMKDLSDGTLLSNFSGTTISNTVTNPTLVSAVVSNSTPTHIDLTWSEAINSTLSAFGNFAVSSGHTLTAHTYVDATHSYLTTSAAFVASETKTLAYTPNGTNDMQDTQGNKVAAFSGTAITDNVGGAGSIAYTATLFPTPVNFTTGGYDDWVMDNGTATYYQKGSSGTPTGLITITKVNLTDPGWGHESTINTCNAGDCAQSAGALGSDAFGHDAQVAGTAKLQFTCPATASAHHAYVYFQPDGSENMTLRLSLSDASVAPVVITVPSQASEAGRLYTITYNSGLSGTFTASLETGSGLSTKSYFLFNSFAYKAS